MMATDKEDGVYTTGGQVDEITMALIDSAYDKDAEVRAAINASLAELGKTQPQLVLSSCHSYLFKHPKLPQGHRVVVLMVMERILRDSVQDLDTPLVLQLVRQASHEMTQSKEIHPEWQTAASDVLVALGKHFCTEVMSDLQDKFQPGVLPHYFVVMTMGNLALANVYGMVPFMKVILGTMLPMMGMAKQDNMRWVFSSALAKFSEAILDYIANIEKAPDRSVKKEIFSPEIDACYDIVFNVWLASKEPKLRLAIVDAIGQMSHIMTREKLDEQLPRLLQGLLGLYKKHPEPFHITQGLCMVLGAATAEGNVRLEPHLESLFSVLFPQTCQPVDYSLPYTVKNHHELLRCFHVLTTAFSDRMIAYLLQKLESNTDKVRLGTLAIFRHLINSAGDHMENKKPLLLTGLKSILNDPNNKVKKSLAQTIMSMSHHGYLELEGGQEMIEFIVRQCALQPDPQAKRSPDPEFVSNEALRSMCENVLQLLTTTVDCMAPPNRDSKEVLWPYLLEFVIPETYTDAMSALCKALAHLANQHRETPDEPFEIDYAEETNIPKPAAIIARLMVMAGRPLNGHNRGLQVLAAMKGLVPCLEPNLVALWDTIIPKLVIYIEDAQESGDEWCQKSWEDLLLKMLSKSLDAIDAEDWVCELGEAMTSQLVLYVNSPEEKNFLMKCIGIVMRKATKKDFVNTTLGIVLTSVKHTNTLEREGCAISLGYAASSHLDPVISRLDTAMKNEAKRSSSFFSFIKDMNKADVDEKVKATYILCYGYVTLYAPVALIVSRLETSVIKVLTSNFPVAKDQVFRQSLVKTVDLVGQTVHPDHIKTKLNFAYRNELLTLLQGYLNAEPREILQNDMRALTLQACATLVKLDPVLGEDEVASLLSSALGCFMAVPPDGGVTKKIKEESYEEVLEQEACMDCTYEALQELLKQLILKKTSPEGLEWIFKMLQGWMESLDDYERERSLDLCHHVFRLYLDRSNVSHGVVMVDGPEGDHIRFSHSSHHPGNLSHFYNLGLLLARLVPRCSDPSTIARQTAVDCVHTVLKIALQYQGPTADHQDKMIEAFPTLRERLYSNDPTTLFNCMKDLSKVLIKYIPVDQLLPFIYQLMSSLQDPHDQSSSGTCVILNSIVKARGTELTHEVEKLVHAIHDHLKEITCPQTRTGTLRVLRTLAGHHLLAVLNTLLQRYSLPFDAHVVEMWGAIAQDPLLMQSTIEHLLEMLQRSLPYEEKQDGTRTATPLPLTATCAMTEMFKVEEVNDCVTENFPQLLAAVMVRIASMICARPPKVGKPIPKLELPFDAANPENGDYSQTPMQDEHSNSKSKEKKKAPEKAAAHSHKELDIKPSSSSVAALRELLKISRNDAMADALTEQEAWEMFEDVDAYPDAFKIMSTLMVNFQPEYISRLITCLNPVLRSVYEPQRIMAAAFFAELINQRCAGDLTLVEMLVNGLLERLVDTSHVVRMLCIRGLGNVASCGPEQVQKYSTTVLSAMMLGMDDKDDIDDDITLEAMSGLSRILAEIDEMHIRAILINISLRIRPCFEKEKAAVRAAAFTLFGNLSRFGDGPSKDPFLEQVHTNLISLLLHLNDPDLEVRKACKFALRLLSPVLGSNGINSMFQQHLLKEGTLHYGEFINDLSKVMILDFPDKLNFYVMGNVTFFKSTWPEIRGNAAMATGFLLGNMSIEHYTAISKEHVCGALILLLKDQQKSVRIKAAEAMSQLQNF